MTKQIMTKPIMTIFPFGKLSKIGTLIECCEILGGVLRLVKLVSLNVWMECARFCIKKKKNGEGIYIYIYIYIKGGQT